jgi:hypothetical protein
VHTGRRHVRRGGPSAQSKVLCQQDNSPNCMYVKRMASTRPAPMHYVDLYISCGPAVVTAAGTCKTYTFGEQNGGHTQI